eukprot:TRINITY_DN7717_c0_g1_i1.p1 TRINITY_DN7717_c0_g1~~TRINITY_DN7717_c0_g1_i1.p1  ORF type:complete len:400 (+),score=9.89 TRINITY_DN7717_c0_g1_i1:51-1250(+)
MYTFPKCNPLSVRLSHSIVNRRFRAPFGTRAPLSQGNPSLKYRKYDQWLDSINTPNRCILSVQRHLSVSSTTFTSSLKILTTSRRSSNATFKEVTVADALQTRWASIKDRLFFGPAGAYLRLMRLDKPIGTWLLLLPCLWSITIATPFGQLPDLQLVALFSLGSLIMRGAGCTINDLIDQDIDKQVERTRSRPLASGELNTKQAIAFLAVQLSAGLAVLLCLNNYSIILGASSLILVGLYPLMKRITYWPQAVLGLTFNWGALLGYSAVAGYCDWGVTLPLYTAGLSWTLVYDTIYAHQDKDDDMIAGVKSTALRFGESTKKWLTFFSTAAISGLVLSGMNAGLTYPYFMGVGLGALHLAWQIKSVDINNKSDCLAKFKANKWFGWLIFLGALTSKFVS